MHIHVLSFHNTQFHHGVSHSVQKSLSFKHHQFQWQTQSNPEKAMYTCTERKGTMTTSCLDNLEIPETRRIQRAVVGKASLSINDFTFNKQSPFTSSDASVFICRCHSLNQNDYFFTHVFANVLNFGSN